MTRDLVPVVYSGWALPVEGFQLGVTDIDFAQFDQLARRKTIDIDSLAGSVTATSSAADWHSVISASMTPLDRILAVSPASLTLPALVGSRTSPSLTDRLDPARCLLQLVPNHFGVNLECRYTTVHDARRLSFNHNVDGNDYVDAILRVVYEAGNAAASPTRNRKIVFSAFDPTVASFLNFKQPNYAVFFSSHCGLARSRPDEPPRTKLEPIEFAEEDDKRCLSVREAVKFAKANNLLGVMLDATLIAQVPHLIYSIKESGLILAVFGSSGQAPLGKIMARGCCGAGPPSLEGIPSVDACMQSGCVRPPHPVRRARTCR